MTQPVYAKIADQLRRQIADGELQPGQMVPSEKTLARRHAVARGTVRAALRVLVGEGFIEVVPGRGRRVVGEGTASDAASVWARIAVDLQKRIGSGEFADGRPLPSEADLQAHYRVGRNTVRQAYRHLSDAGAVVVKPGVGAFPVPR